MANDLSVDGMARVKTRRLAAELAVMIVSAQGSACSVRSVQRIPLQH
jgi:hypothetical protein